jgi:predicted transposase/invertase (TIGR01784 family)
LNLPAVLLARGSIHPLSLIPHPFAIECFLSNSPTTSPSKAKPLAYDNICKYLVAEYPVAFARWLVDADIVAIEPLPSELRVEPIRPDALLLLPDRKAILHIEFQTLPTSMPPLPFRMLDYWVRIRRQYSFPITQVVIFLQETNSEQACINEFVAENTRHRYQVIRMWEQDAAPFLANPALLPLATLAQTNSPPALLERVASQVDMLEEIEQRRNIATCAEVLAGLRFDKNLIRQFLREDLVQESVIYQEILQKGIQQGVQQGVQQGRQEGRQEGQREEAIAIALRLLNRRLGTIEPNLLSQIQQLPNPQIEELIEASLDFATAQDLVLWLETH